MAPNDFPAVVEGERVAAPIGDVVADIAAGKMVILVDDEDPESEGDLCIAAEAATPEAINFMATHARGLIRLTLVEEQLQKLRLDMMVPEHENTGAPGSAFAVSIEAREGVTTGISAAGPRAHDPQVAIDGRREAGRPRRARATSSRSAPAKAAVSCAASARPRAPSTSRGMAGLRSRPA